MRSQSMPIRTIVLIIIILIVLAAVVIMFLGFMGGNISSQTNASLGIAENLSNQVT